MADEDTSMQELDDSRAEAQEKVSALLEKLAVSQGAYIEGNEKSEQNKTADDEKAEEAASQKASAKKSASKKTSSSSRSGD
jgi:hypothetical protein